MTADWIIAIVAVASLLSGIAGVYSHLVAKIAKLQGHVDALDLEISRLVRQQQRIENLLLTLLGRVHGTLDAPRSDL